METYRLKNIIILILLLLNLFLLLLITSRYSSQIKASQDLISQTVSLLEKNNILIEAPLLREDKESLSAYSVDRNKKEEAAFVAAFLGTALSVNDIGGGTDLYDSISGSAAFRSNGSFSLNRFSFASPISYYETFVSDYCPSHYREVNQQEEDGILTVTALPFIKDLPVYSASIDFVFEENSLTTISGYFMPSSEGSAQATSSISKCSAVVSLMDYCHAEGHICNQITGLSTGYLLQSTVSIPLLLSPVYKIDTNMSSYYVNVSTGHVFPTK